MILSAIAHAIAVQEKIVQVRAMAQPEDLDQVMAKVDGLTPTYGRLGALEEAARRLAYGWTPRTPVAIAGILDRRWLDRAHPNFGPMAMIVAHVLSIAAQEGVEPVGSLTVTEHGDIWGEETAVRWRLDPPEV